MLRPPGDLYSTVTFILRLRKKLLKFVRHLGVTVRRESFRRNTHTHGPPTPNDRGKVAGRLCRGINRKSTVINNPRIFVF